MRGTTGTPHLRNPLRSQACFLTPGCIMWWCQASENLEHSGLWEEQLITLVQLAILLGQPL